MYQFQFRFGGHHLDLLLAVRPDNIPNKSVRYSFQTMYTLYMIHSFSVDELIIRLLSQITNVAPIYPRGGVFEIPFWYPIINVSCYRLISTSKNSYGIYSLTKVSYICSTLMLCKVTVDDNSIPITVSHSFKSCFCHLIPGKLLTRRHISIDERG